MPNAAHMHNKKEAPAPKNRQFKTRNNEGGETNTEYRIRR